jgi:hypothetical protein
MPRRPRPTSRRPPKASILAQENLEPRPKPVAKLKSRVEEPLGSSSDEDDDKEGHPGVMEGSSDDDDEEDPNAPRISQWLDDDEDLYGNNTNDEPVRPPVHCNAFI